MTSSAEHPGERAQVAPRVEVAAAGAEVVDLERLDHVGPDPGALGELVDAQAEADPGGGQLGPDHRVGGGLDDVVVDEERRLHLGLHLEGCCRLGGELVPDLGLLVDARRGPRDGGRRGPRPRCRGPARGSGWRPAAGPAGSGRLAVGGSSRCSSQPWSRPSPSPSWASSSQPLSSPVRSKRAARSEIHRATAGRGSGKRRAGASASAPASRRRLRTRLSSGSRGDRRWPGRRPARGGSR